MINSFISREKKGRKCHKRKCKYLSRSRNQAPPSSDMSSSSTLLDASQSSISGFSQTPGAVAKLSKKRGSQPDSSCEPVARKRQKLQIEHEKMLRIEDTMLEKKKDPRGPAGFSYRCLKCHTVINMRIRAVAHAAKCNKKSTAKKRAKSKKSLPCNVCGVTASTLTDLKRHRRVEHPHLVHQKKCTCCNTKFSSLKNYKRHIARRKSNVSFKCKACGKRFSTSGNLKKHMKVTHQAEQPAAMAENGDVLTSSTSTELSEAVRRRNETILVFTDRLVQRARELGESEQRIEEIKRIQMKKLIIPESAPLPPLSSSQVTTKKPPQKQSLPSRAATSSPDIPFHTAAAPGEPGGGVSLRPEVVLHLGFEVL